MDNRFAPAELFPKARIGVLPSDERGFGIDVMAWRCWLALPNGQWRTCANPAYPNGAGSPDPPPTAA